MASTSNKLRFGASNVHYALYDASAGTFGAWQPLAGAIQITFDSQGEPTIHYADNCAYATTTPNASDTGSIELFDMTEQAKADLLAYVTDETSTLTYEESSAQHPTFALGYQVNGDGNNMRAVRYATTLSRPSTAASTTTDSTDPDTLTLDLTCIGFDVTIGTEKKNILQAYCLNAGTQEAAYNKFFDQVLLPGVAVPQ